MNTEVSETMKAIIRHADSSGSKTAKVYFSRLPHSGNIFFAHPVNIHFTKTVLGPLPDPGTP